MKSKKKLLIAILLIGLLIVLVVSFFVFKNKKDNNQKETIVEKYIPTSSRNQSSTTSLDLIDEDYQKKEIDYETYLLYKVQAVFGDYNNLPKKYQSKFSAFEDGGVISEVQENYNQLSVKTKQALAPYFKRPNDPDSYWAQALNPPKTTSFNFIDTANAYDRPNSYKSEDALVTADNKIRVWYIEKIVTEGETEVRKKLYYDVAKNVVDNLNKDKAHSRYNSLLGVVPPSDGSLGGDNKIDIYIAAATHEHIRDVSGPSLGVNVPDNGISNSSFIMVRNNLKDKVLKTTTVHELFHAFQRAFKCQIVKANLWWIEGTATWSEDFIYPKLDTEHEWVVEYIPKPEVILTKADGKHEYGAYVFPFYLSQKYNDEIIKKVFSGCVANPNPLKSVDKVEEGFKKNWKEFTLWNYNKIPAKYYKDDSGKFPTDSSEVGANADMPMIAGIGQTEIGLKELKQLTSQVVDVNIINDDGKIRKVVFKDLNKFTDKSERAGLKAIVYPASNEQPYVEDWTDKDRRAFCFDNNKEKIKRVVLITSNGNLQDKISSTNIKVKTKELCYEIDQAEVVHSKPLFALSAGYVGVIDFSADGDLQPGTVGKDAKYNYLGKWKVDVKYFEKWPPQGMMGISGTKMDFKYDHKLEFDLSTIDEDGSFIIDMQAGKFETPGWDIINHISGDVTNIPQNTTDWDTSQQKGIVYDMTENGAKVKLPESVLYNSGGYRNLPKPFILEIKKN